MSKCKQLLALFQLLNITDTFYASTHMSILSGLAFTLLSVYGNKIAASAPNITSAFKVEGEMDTASHSCIYPFLSEKQKTFTDDAHISINSLGLSLVIQIHIKLYTRHLLESHKYLKKTGDLGLRRYATSWWS